MSNTSWNAEATGLNQENRDRYIANNWGVRTPYVLFCNHPGGAPRYPEMVMPTQIYRSLIELVPLTDAKAAVAAKNNPSPMPFRKQMKAWNIKVPGVTRAEFRRYLPAEKEYYDNSAP